MKIILLSINFFFTNVQYNLQGNKPNIQTFTNFLHKSRIFFFFIYNKSKHNDNSI